MASYDDKFYQSVQGGKKHVIFDGLLDKAHELWGNDGFSLTVDPIQIPSKENGMVAVCVATLTCPLGVFTDVGDASPDNVSGSIAKHMLRMASTRAKGRVLRDSQNHGEPTAEEMQVGEQRNEEPQEKPAVASKKDRLELATLISQAGRSVDKFEERYGKIEEISEGNCNAWIDRLKQEVDAAEGGG